MHLHQRRHCKTTCEQCSLAREASAQCNAETSGWSKRAATELKFEGWRHDCSSRGTPAPERRIDARVNDYDAMRRAITTAAAAPTAVKAAARTVGPGSNRAAASASSIGRSACGEDSLG